MIHPSAAARGDRLIARHARDLIDRGSQVQDIELVKGGHCEASLRGSSGVKITPTTSAAISPRMSFRW